MRRPFAALCDVPPRRRLSTWAWPLLWAALTWDGGAPVRWMWCHLQPQAAPCEGTPFVPQVEIPDIEVYDPNTSGVAIRTADLRWDGDEALPSSARTRRSSRQ